MGLQFPPFFNQITLSRLSYIEIWGLPLVAPKSLEPFLDGSLTFCNSQSPLGCMSACCGQGPALRRLCIPPLCPVQAGLVQGACPACPRESLPPQASLEPSDQEEVADPRGSSCCLRKGGISGSELAFHTSCPDGAGGMDWALEAKRGFQNQGGAL